MSEDTIRLEVSAEPRRLEMGSLAAFTISMSATNQGGTVVDPELGRAQLLVNDEPSKAFSLAVGNGKREPAWFALPPGETVSMTWSTLGPSLFPAPGHYSLRLHVGDAETPPVEVEIEP